MIDTHYNKANEIKIMPIRAAYFYNPSLLGGFVHFFYLEKGSGYLTEAITMPHYEGGEEQQGHLIKVDMIIPHNKYDSNGLIDLLEKIISRSKAEERLDFQVMIGDAVVTGMSGDYSPDAINSNYGLWVEMNTALIWTYSIDHKDIRPKIIMKGEGFLYKINDIVNTPSAPIKFYNQTARN